MFPNRLGPLMSLKGRVEVCRFLNHLFPGTCTHLQERGNASLDFGAVQKPNKIIQISDIVRNPNSLGMERFLECPKSKHSVFGR